MPRRYRPGLPLQDHRRRLTTHTEVTAFRWADETDILQLTTQAYAIRFLDALRRDAAPAIRQHDGTDLID
jgi:8-oxo-dGTP diphosphatase